MDVPPKSLVLVAEILETEHILDSFEQLQFIDWLRKEVVRAGREGSFDITEFIHDFLMARLAIRKLPEVVALHPTCSTRKMGLVDKLQNIAETCAAQVIVPEEVSCCGWAGDKGFTVPELNESAVRNLRPSLSDDCVAGYSTGRTCEIGLSFHSGRYYRSIAYLLDRCSEPRVQTHSNPIADDGCEA